MSGTAITASGSRANGILTSNGGAASVHNSSVLTNTLAGVAALVDTGSTLVVTNSSISATAPTAHGLRALAGSSATMTGGSVTTEGRDAAALSAGGSTITATNVTVATLGNDNAMGVLADGASLITVNGGSVTTSGSSVRDGARPHGLAARNPGGTLVVTGTTVLTRGAEAFGAVSDDGGSMTLSGVSIRTEDTLNLGPRQAGAIGLFSVVEQVGPQFAANLTANNTTVETLGPRAHGALAQQNFLAAPAIVTLNDSTVTTRGAAAVGLRAVTAGTVIANRSPVLTQGVAAHGALARDNGSSVTINQTSVLATGAVANGAVAESGGLITGIDSTVTATGASAAALYATGASGFVSVANFTNSTLTNRSGPTIGVGGVANVRLTNTTAGGSGQWLRVGTINNFPPLLGAEAPSSGIPDLPDDPDVVPPPNPPIFSAPPALPVVPGLANVVLDRSMVTGSAFTAPGSVSNVTMINNSVWNMTGDSNLTNLTNAASLIDYSPPVGGVFKKLTVVNYLGAGGAIGLNTFLGNDGSPSDQLVIVGGTATGNTFLRVTNAGGPGALTTSDGIRVVDAINGATTAPGAFALDGRVVAGAFEYRLFRGGVVDPNDNDWYLRSERVTPGPGRRPPLFRPEVPAYLGNQRAATFMFVHTVHERLGEPQFTEAARQGCDSRVGSVWLRSVGHYYDVDPYGSFPFDQAAATWLVQGGGDVAQWSLLGENDRLHLGGMVGFGQAHVTARAVGNPFKATGNVDGYSAGVYATWYENDAERLGLYVDSWALFGQFDNEVRGDALPTVDYDPRLLTLSPEVGFAFKPLAGRFVLEPQAQLLYTYYAQDDLIEPNGTRVTGANENLFTSRLGLRAYGAWVGRGEGMIQFYLEFNWWHDFQSESIAFNNLVFGGGVPNDRFDTGVGFNALVGNNVSLWVNAEYQFGAHDYQGVEGLAGMKYSW